MMLTKRSQGLINANININHHRGDNDLALAPALNSFKLVEDTEERYGVNVRLARGCQARFAGLVEPGRPAGGGRPQLDLHGLGANEAAVFM